MRTANSSHKELLCDGEPWTTSRFTGSQTHPAPTPQLNHSPLEGESENPADVWGRLSVANHSPLEGESENQGHSPQVNLWGELIQELDDDPDFP